MGRAVMIDGSRVPLEQATVSVFDRGFLYGDSVFETIRTYGGRPFELDRHLSRLARSSGAVFIDLPVSTEVLAREIGECIQAAGNAESYVRVMLTRGSGELGIDPALSAGALRVIIVAPLQPPPEEAYNAGIGAVTFATRRVADGTAVAGAKIGNYLVSVLGMRAARARGAAEALIVDGDGRIVEGATSNVFFVERGALVTPPEDTGILPGITRGVVLDVARELGIGVTLRAPRVDEVFDEVFISSSIRELLSVVRLDGKPVGGGAPGPVFRRILAAFRDRVRRGESPPPHSAG
jgi:branched-chain amino acid aminotransferase